MALAYIDSNDIEIYRVDSNGNSVFMSYVNEVRLEVRKSGLRKPLT